MAIPDHVERLMQGAKAWNSWRRKHRDVRPDLGAEPVSDLEYQIKMLVAAVVNEVAPGKAPDDRLEGGFAGLSLSGVNLRACSLRGTNFSRANLMLADLRDADLREVNFSSAILTGARLAKSDLRGAVMNGAVLRFATLTGAKLDGAMLRLCNLDHVGASRASLRDVDLSFASLNEARLSRADLSGSFVYGCSAWNVDLTGATQRDLRITPTSEGLITVDNLKVAQFIHTLINNKNVRQVIDTLTTKLVLILGRFTPERKAVLEEAKRWLQSHDYVPVLFDFDRPSSRDFTETVVTLAHLARFIVADLTQPASIPKELEAIVPRLAVPVQPILQQAETVYSTFSDYWKHDWVLSVWRYEDAADLRAKMLTGVVRPAEAKARELIARRAAKIARA